MDQFWQDRIRSIVANSARRLSNEQVAEKLVPYAAEARALGWTNQPAPSPRSVGRYRPAPGSEELKPYRLVTYPESFERHDLPWEAAAVALELLHDAGARDRPAVRLVLQCWRIAQSAPQLDRDVRTLSAFLLVAADAGLLGDPELERRQLEAALSGWPAPTPAHVPGPDDDIDVSLLFELIGGARSALRRLADAADLADDDYSVFVLAGRRTPSGARVPLRLERLRRALDHLTAYYRAPGAVGGGLREGES